MIFWDTSALVPLIVDEPTTSAVRQLLERDNAVVTWWGSALECLSALARLEREHVLGIEQADQARAVLETWRQSWAEVLPTEEVRAQASRLLRRHALRAADALQLGAALVWAGPRPEAHAVATLDRRVADAARAEGFTLALGRLAEGARA
ncbi:MAG: type II toxin-antitoxin system VapC family toxin [Elusimicrobiota bacterium]